MSTVAVPIPTESKVLYSRNEAARLLGISTAMLDNLVRAGEIRIRRVGGPVRGRVLFSRTELLRFAEGDTSNKG